MSNLDLLIELDHKLFFLINHTLHHRALNSFFAGLSSLGGWTIGLFTLVLLATEGKRQLGRHCLVLFLFLGMTAAVGKYMKETIDRPRPTAVFAENPSNSEGPLLRVLEKNAPQSYAFPSGHSLTAFFMLVYAGQRRRSFRPWLLLLAGGIALARVYVGVHFPLDCLAGALIGSLGALLASATFHRLEERLWISTSPVTAPLAQGNNTGATLCC